ncbi:MAG: SRPBCC domain-containing protein [Thermomicrobiales bacterium]|nr:SRPBCC domain-containing protein [Thermomicrobiales bacterium]
MEVRFNVAGRIAKPVHEVFEAVANPEHLSHFFTTGGAKGRIETGATVMWDFHDFPGAFPVWIEEVIPDEKIVLRWQAAEGTISSTEDGSNAMTTVEMTFTPLEDDRTLVEIIEYGWDDSEQGYEAAFGNCVGWTGMLAAMKAWLEYGINLREGFYV